MQLKMKKWMRNLRAWFCCQRPLMVNKGWTVGLKPQRLNKITLIRMSLPTTQTWLRAPLRRQLLQIVPKQKQMMKVH